MDIQPLATPLAATGCYDDCVRTGYAQLPLHDGHAPRWLFERMVKLARAITLHVAEDYGRDEVLRRLSHPFWFQAFGCVLGFDWHSSGVTTTTCGALKEGLKGLERELGVFVCGGKGAVSRRTPGEIENHCDHIGLDAAPLVRASRLSAKVDSAAVQDGYDLYHHCLVFSADGHWCVIQQGMSDRESMARRYHWLGETVTDFVNEPHAAVCCNRRRPGLNLSAGESGAARARITELASTPDAEVERLVRRLPTLTLPRRHQVLASDIRPSHLHKTLERTYAAAAADFEQLLGVRGVGAKGLRALALVAEIIHGTPASMRDPARFAFAHGGKDGTPYPVDRHTYDQTIAILARALQRAQVAASDRRAAFRRLAKFERIAPEAEDVQGNYGSAD